MSEESEKEMLNMAEENSGKELPAFDVTECRILGTLIEKAFATPDVYPMTVKALVSGCNQKSNRNPAMALESFEIEGALTSLQIKGFVKTVDRVGGRTIRYGQRLGEELGLDRPVLAILAELMLRGPQTVNELKTRIARMGTPLSATEVETLLRDHALGAHPCFRLNQKRQGERYPRWQHLLSPVNETEDSPPLLDDTPPRPRSVSPGAVGDDAMLKRRLEQLEARVTALEKLLKKGQAEEEGESGWLDLD